MSTVANPAEVSSRVTDDEGEQSDLTAFLTRVKPDTLDLIDDQLSSDAAESVKKVISETVMSRRSKNSDKEARIREYLLMIEPKKAGREYYDQSFLEGLHCIPEGIDHDQDLTHTSKPNIDRCKSIIEVTRAIHSLKEAHGIYIHVQEGVIFIDDAPLVRLVIENSSRSSQLASIIATHRTLKIDELKHFLSVTPPLMSGAI